MTNLIKFESSIFEILKNYFRSHRRNRWNDFLCAIGLAAGLIPVFSRDHASYSSLTADISGTLVGVYGTLLGFLLSGFAIFVSAIKPEHLVALASKQDRKTSLPVLSILLGTLVASMIVLLLSLVIMTILYLACKTGFSSTLLSSAQDGVRLALRVVTYSIIGISFSVVSVHVKVFIYNIYCFILTIAALSQKDAQEESQGSSPR